MQTIDDEHNLIVRYATKLAHQENGGVLPSNGSHTSLPSSTSSAGDSIFAFPDLQTHHNLIEQLEASNRQIMSEIQLLRSKESNDSIGLVSELQMLKIHKEELEGRMNKLQDGREDLMEQLDSLMRVLKSRDHRLTSPLHRKRSMTPPTNTKPKTGAYPLAHTTSRQPTVVSRTKRLFPEVFDAADEVNLAMNNLFDQVTSP